MRNDMYQEVRNEIFELVNQWENKLLTLIPEIRQERRNHQNRTIKQLIGHLVDSAANNHHRVVRLHYNDTLDFPDYRSDNDRWIAIQNYQDEDWQNLVALWKFYNLHLIHLFKQVDNLKIDRIWHNENNEAVTMDKIINYYLVHLKLHLGEIDEIINME